MREYRFYTYIVGSDSGTLYTGFTNNLDFRIRQHKNGMIEGSRRNTDAIGCSGMSSSNMLLPRSTEKSKSRAGDDRRRLD
jgi:hypothetical protein